MKVFVFVLFCFTLISNYETVNGGLLKDFFGKVQDTAHTAQQDIRGVFNSNKDQQDIKKTEEGEKDDSNKETADVTHDKKQESENVEKSKENSPESSSSKSPVTPESSGTATSTTVASSVTNGPDDKEGKENFKGGCATGFYKTSDNRCKPTF